MSRVNYLYFSGSRRILRHIQIRARFSWLPQKETCAIQTTNCSDTFRKTHTKGQPKMVAESRLVTWLVLLTFKITSPCTTISSALLIFNVPFFQKVRPSLKLSFLFVRLYLSSGYGISQSLEFYLSQIILQHNNFCMNGRESSNSLHECSLAMARNPVQSWRMYIWFTCNVHVYHHW